jgi:hypothetical protein
LVDIADDQQRRVVWRRFHKRLHQHDVDHLGLVDHEQVAIEGIVGIAFEPAALWIDLQEPVDRLGFDARRLGHALGGAARGSAKQQPHALGRKDLEDRIDDRRLADAWAPGDHQRLRRQRQTDQGRKRVHNADELMSAIVAKRLVEHLARSGFVVMKKRAIGGGAALGRGFEG